MLEGCRLSAAKQTPGKLGNTPPRVACADGMVTAGLLPLTSPRAPADESTSQTAGAQDTPLLSAKRPRQATFNPPLQGFLVKNISEQFSTILLSVFYNGNKF